MNIETVRKRLSELVQEIDRNGDSPPQKETKTKEKTDETVLQAMDLLRDGWKVNHVAKKLGLGNMKCRCLGATVMAEYEGVNWRDEVVNAKCPVMKFVRLRMAWFGEYRRRKLKTPQPLAWASSEVGLLVDQTSRGYRILTKGIPELVEAVENNQIAHSTAYNLSRLSSVEQRKAMNTTNQVELGVFDDLKSRIALMLDHKTGWQRSHGPGQVVFRGLLQQADPAEVQELVSYLKLVHAWVGTIVDSLET